MNKHQPFTILRFHGLRFFARRRVAVYGNDRAIRAIENFFRVPACAKRAIDIDFIIRRPQMRDDFVQHDGHMAHNATPFIVISGK